MAVSEYVRANLVTRNPGDALNVRNPLNRDAALSPAANAGLLDPEAFGKLALSQPGLFEKGV